MRKGNAQLGSALAEPIRRFVAHKRALNRRFHNEESTLRMLDRYLVEQGVLDLLGVKPAVVEAFLSSRPRIRPGSYNRLLAIVPGLFDWMVLNKCSMPLPYRCVLAATRHGAFRICSICQAPLVLSKALPHYQIAGGQR
jgi:hypothetical protein